MLRDKKTFAGIMIFTVLFAALCIYRYHDFLFMLPYGMHEEAQSDRLALAIQFYDHGMNFFLPRTYNTYPIDGITGVEFPIHSYTAALMGHVFGRDNISTSFRLLTLLITYGGLLALYLSCFRVTKNYIASLFVPLFLFYSPSFAFYACNYMPDVAAGSISFIGIYFFLYYYETGSFKFLQRAVIFLTLAALVKTTVGIVLLSVMGFCFLDILFFKRFIRKADVRKIIILYACSLVAIMAYFLYNKYLTEKYHSYIFVLRILPFYNWEEVKLYFGYSLTHTFLNEYFVVPQYPLIVLTLIAGIFVLIRDKRKQYFAWFIALMFSGCLACTFIFGSQLIHHDYYFVSMWQPAITIALLITFTEISLLISRRKQRVFFTITTLLVLVVVFVFSNKMLQGRIQVSEERYPGGKKILASTWMKDGDKILDKIGIGRDSTIFILDEAPANIGQVYFDRRGRNASPASWRGNIFNVRDYMKDGNIRIMVCNAEKMPEIKTTYARHFDEVFKELYIDSNCAVYYLRY